MMNLGEAPKRMHDPKAFLANQLMQDHMKIMYVHQEIPDDSIYRGAKHFSEVVRRIPTPQEKIVIFQYQKELKTTVLHYRKLKLTMK